MGGEEAIKNASREGYAVATKKTEAQQKAQQKYMERFAVARVRLEKESYERIKAAAEAQGQSVNGYIVEAVNEKMERDGA